MEKKEQKEKGLSIYNEVESKITVIRQVPVMADADVAELYGVQTKEINQAVRNNPDKFPSGYLLVLTKSELRDLRSKNLTTNVSAKSRSATKAFTEKGLYMLARPLLEMTVSNPIFHEKTKKLLKRN